MPPSLCTSDSANSKINVCFKIGFSFLVLFLYNDGSGLNVCACLCQQRGAHNDKFVETRQIKSSVD